MSTSSLTPSTTHVHIQGSGIVAHVAALALARQGLSVALSAQRVTPGHGDVRAYAINAASKALLQSLKIWDAMPANAVCPVSTMQVQSSDGAAIDFNAPSNADALAWIVDVPLLEQTLRSAVGFASGIRQLKTDENCPSQLTLVCEGRASQTRAHLGVTFDITPYGHTAIAARLHTTIPHHNIARQWFGAPRRGDILALLPLATINDVGQSGNFVALVWSIEPAHAQELLAMPPESFEHELTHACGAALGEMRLSSERLAWPLQRAIAQRCTGEGWALVGDAAHNVHPLAGQGLNLGLGDVQALSEVLAQREPHRSVGDARLLRRYERARSGAVAAMSQATDALYSVFNHTDAKIQTLRRWGVQSFNASTPLKSWTIRQAMGL